jgi:hypothetical protein
LLDAANQAATAQALMSGTQSALEHELATALAALATQNAVVASLTPEAILPTPPATTSAGLEGWARIEGRG